MAYDPLFLGYQDHFSSFGLKSGDLIMCFSSASIQIVDASYSKILADDPQLRRLWILIECILLFWKLIVILRTLPSLLLLISP